MNPSLQALLPQRRLSGLVGWLGRRERPRWLVRLFLRWFAKRYGVNLEEMARPMEDYRSFTDFFTRRLKEGTRAMPEDLRALASPADGAVAASGIVEKGRAIQAKGIDYEISRLLGDPTLALLYEGGPYRTIYLSPKDYHRVHAPNAGTLLRRIHLGGKLFSVSTDTVNRLPGVFSENERVVLQFDDPVAGRWAIVFVGALVVGGIETLWEGTVNPLPRGLPADRTFQGKVRVERGDEIGLFRAGSTVICFWEKGRAALDPFEDNAPVRMGQKIGSLQG